MDKPLKPGTRVVAESDLLDAPGADEVGEVTRGCAVVKEVPAPHSQPDLDGGARSEGVVPAMAVETADLAAVIGARNGGFPAPGGGTDIAAKSTWIRRA